uniref:Protein-tyrosine-phosphatase n=1 Tax=Meloidogyne floridensis TaxID=298350 RepID=A0A915NJ91_9BILA
MLTKTTNIPLNNSSQNHLTNPKHSSNIPDRPSSSSPSSSSINSLSSSKRKKQNGVWWGILEEKEENKFNHFDSSRSSFLLNKNNRYLNHRSSSVILHRNGTFRQKGPAQKIISVERPPIYYYLFKRNYINLRAHKIQEEKAMLQAPTAPISAAKFVAYVQERRKKRILFKGEFLMIQRSVDPQRLTTEVGIRMGEKNQYPDTLPYDQNRVILEHRPGVEDSHYINASYVNSWLRERAYVVTQSVRNKQASNEFWRCVWEIGANTIVMLTKIFDFMRVVCLQYWPQTQFQFGEIHVETLDTRTYAHFVCGVGDLTTTTSTDGKGEAQRNINDNSEERIVKHFHFTEWELNSFPYISAFVEVRRRVRQWMERSPVDSPIVVHCSNGGGRSGAFLAVDANLELLQRTGQLDVFEYARTLINSRQNLISSVEQYTFIYDVLCEAVLCNVQPMAMHQLKDRSTMYKARKNRELMELQDSHENKLLTMLTAPLRIGDCAGGHRLENRGKNRDVMVPPDHARPYLQTLHGESKDYTYINAVEVDGFTRKAEFIVTEWPKQQTLDSFWTLVFDHNVHTVICLTNQPTDTKARKREFNKLINI